MTASPINEIRTIESDGQHFIDLWLDGHEMQRRGPFASHEIAEAMAARLAAACGSLFGKLMEIRHGWRLSSFTARSTSTATSAAPIGLNRAQSCQLAVQT